MQRVCGGAKGCIDIRNFDGLEFKRINTVKTDPDSDVQLVFVGEENTNGSLLLY